MQYIDIIVRAVIRQNDALLLCKNKSSANYFLPGGHIEFGETSEAALIRELDEELGATISDLRFLLIHENRFVQNGEEKHEINVLFTASMEESPIESKEDHLEFAWIPLAAIPNTNLLPAATRVALINVFAGNTLLPPERVFISSI